MIEDNFIIFLKIFGIKFKYITACHISEIQEFDY